MLLKSLYLLAVGRKGKPLTTLNFEELLCPSKAERHQHIRGLGNHQPYEGQVLDSAAGMGQLWMYTHTGEQDTGGKPCRKGPGGCDGWQVKRGFQCSQEVQLCSGAHHLLCCHLVKGGDCFFVVIPKSSLAKSRAYPASCLVSGSHTCQFKLSLKSCFVAGESSGSLLIGRLFLSLVEKITHLARLVWYKYRV